jgi:hypothetical protein
MTRKSQKHGPEPERLKITGDWEAAVAKSMQAKKPEGGWPKPTPMPQRSHKGKKKPKD